MDHFGADELRELLTEATGPAVSLYLPTHRTNREADADRLRFRAALKRAQDGLARMDRESADGSVSSVQARLAELETRAREREFWLHQAAGLAVFLGPGLTRVYRLPGADFRELAVVAPAFHVRPLVRYLQRPDAYWLLDISEKRVRLWSGWAGGLVPMDLRRLPRSLTDALGIVFERDYPFLVVRKESVGVHGEHGRGGIQPVFHGHGVGPDDDEPERLRFYRRVDAALQEVLRGTEAPLVLAAVRDHHAGYRAASGLANLAGEGIEADVRDWSARELHEAAWLIAVRAWEQNVDRALELWESAHKAGKTETDPAALGRLAVAGRIRLLLARRDARLAAILDRETGRVEILGDDGATTGGEPAERGRDLVDELAEVVLLHDGRVLILAAERMPDAGELAAVLR